MKATIHLTHKCNLGCHYCYTGDKGLQSMKKETAIQSFQFLSNHTLEEGEPHLNITFIGGEPLLHKDLIYDIVAESETMKANGLKYSFAVNTNGTLFDHRFLDFVKEKGIHLILSLDGKEESHDIHRSYHSGDGSFTKIMTAIPEALNADPDCHLLCVITPETAKDLSKNLAFFVDLGFYHVIAVSALELEWSEAQLTDLKREYKRAAKLYLSLFKREKPVSFNFFDDKIFRHVDPEKMAEQCDMMVGSFSVAPSGNIYPCVQFVGEDNQPEYIIGNIWKGLNRDKISNYLSMRANGPKTCVDCPYPSQCHNDCGCVNTRYTGDMTKVSHLHCAHEKILIPIANNLASKLYKQKNNHFMKRFYGMEFVKC